MTDAPRLFPATPARLGTWLDCPRMYRFRYVDRPTPPAAPPTAEQSWGNSIHAALRAFFDTPLAERVPALVGRLVGEHWIRAGWRDEEQERRWRDRAEEAITVYLAAAGWTCEPVGAERTVGATYRGMALSGRIDRIDARPEGLVIVDYKTGRRPPTRDDTRGSLALAVYAYAAWRTLRRRVAAVELHHVPSGTVAAHEHGDDALRRHLDRAAEIAEKIQSATEYPPVPGPLCGWCSYLASCDAGLASVGGVIREPWETIERRDAAPEEEPDRAV